MHYDKLQLKYLSFFHESECRIHVINQYITILEENNGIK